MPSAACTTRISRRTFLRSVSIVAAGAFVAACAVERGTTPAVKLVDPVLRDVVVPSLRTIAEEQESPPELAEFLALSVLLTGVDDLDPELGTVYLKSLQNSSELSVTVPELLEQAKAGQGALPTTMADLESSDIFEGEGSRQLADRITEYWYTGVYETEQGEQAVATFVDALAWKTLTFTKPMSVCGTYQFWTEPPEAAID